MAELHLLSPAGFRAGGTYAGIKSKQANDVGLLVCDTAATAAAVFTTNKVFAAPVKIGRDHVRAGRLRGVVVNSGNANACTGKQGERDALRMCELAANVIGAKRAEMLPSSTGIIGHMLPMEKVERGIIAAGAKLGSGADHAAMFAEAIMTTDLKRKSAAAQVKLHRRWRLQRQRHDRPALKLAACDDARLSDHRCASARRALAQAAPGSRRRQLQRRHRR
jgi:glutamate N-acetyltransferase/amino-acid N-acetyltransferase